MTVSPISPTAMINLDSIGARVSYLIRTKGIRINALANTIGLSGQGLRDILSGKSKNPKADVVVSLSRELGVSTDWLLRGADSSNFSGFELNEPTLVYGGARASARSQTSVPFVQLRNLPHFVEHYQEPSSLDDAQRFSVPDHFALKGEVIAFEVEGESLAPEVRAGSVVICTAETGDMRYVQSGLLYAALYAGHFNIKRINNLVERENVLELLAPNPSYAPVRVKVSDIQKLWRVQLVLHRV